MPSKVIIPWYGSMSGSVTVMDILPESLPSNSNTSGEVSVRGAISGLVVSSLRETGASGGVKSELYFALFSILTSPSLNGHAKPP